MALPTTMLPFLLLLIAFSGLLPRCLLAAPTTFTESLDVSQKHLTGATYASFMKRLDTAVERTTHSRESIQHRPLLGEQNLSKPPAYWINVELTADGKRLLTLAIRSDNLYVSGFRNRHGDWFAFAGEGKKLPSKSSALSYTGDYPKIFVGKGWTGLAYVLVNRDTVLDNARILAEYSRSGAGPDPSDIRLKPALGFFILTISEAERFLYIRGALAVAMDNPNPQFMGEPMAKRVVHWKTLSCALRFWDLHKQSMDAWNANAEALVLKTELYDFTPQAALAEIHPLLRSKNCSWMPRSAAPMDNDDGPTVQLRPASASVRAE